MPRVAVIVLDAAEWWHLDRMMASGRMPNLARLRARSAEIPLVTEMAYRTELVWARFLSGREPIDEKDWAASSRFEPTDYTLHKHNVTMARPFYAWDPSMKVIALDLVHSHAVDGVDGAQVVSWGSHSPQWVRSSEPPGLLTEIDRRFGVNPAFGNEFGYGWFDLPYLEALSGACEVGADRRFDAARWLLEQNPDWDLFVTAVSEFHTIGHQMWHGVDERSPLHATPWGEWAGQRVEQAMSSLDATVGRLLDALPDDITVVVCALHGMMPADDLVATLLAPELFHRLHVGRGRGLLRDPDQEAWIRDGMPVVVPEPGESWGEYVADRFAVTPKQRLRRALRGRMPRAAFDRLLRLTGAQAAGPPQSAMANRTPPEMLDITPEAIAELRAGLDFQTVTWYRRFWRSMPYFALPTFGDAHVRVNLAGRERDGIVDRDDYRRACEDAVAELSACHDPRTGRSVVADVIRLRDADPYDPAGPDADLLVVFDGAPDSLRHAELGLIGPFPHLRAASHSANGFALISGPGVQPGPRDARPTIDLTPTVVSLVGADPSRCAGASFAQLVP